MSEVMGTGPRKSRRRGDARRAAAAGDSGPVTLAQQAPGQARLMFEPARIVSDDELESLHQASLEVLETIGIDVMLPEARDYFSRAGASVDGERVRIPGEVIMNAIATVPSRFTFHARNPDKTIQLGDGWLAFGTVGSAPNSADLANGRRPGNLEDYRRFLKLAQSFNCIDFISGYPVEPIDVHASVRHLVALKDMALMTEKPFHAYSLGPERIRDGIEIARIARGVSHEQLETEPSLFTIINTNSPLKMDVPMLQGVIEMARRNQIVCVTPFTLSGAMAPVTVAGALVQQNAEALAGIALTQLVRPGAPAIYGGFTSNVDMKSGAPAFGTPEYMKAAMVSGQLARRYHIPYRTSNTCAANALDAQAAYESVFSLWGVTMGGGNLVMHGAGWMEGGLVASMEKFVLDCDLIQMVKSFLQPLDLRRDALGLDAMDEVGPGGHFFGCAHTMARYESAFYSPLISDWRNFEQWQSTGSPHASDKAQGVLKQVLETYQTPAIDPAVEEELEAFVARRTEEGGAPTDF
ncbi:MAG: trimethylamine methyltransferase family protein [Anderseniella sp.]